MRFAVHRWIGAALAVSGTALILAACGDDPFCVEQRVTITQGLYGRVMYQTDFNPKDHPPVPVKGASVDVLDMPRGSGAVVARATSDVDGVFQVDLPVGTYGLCGDQFSGCDAFTIAPSTLVRADLVQAGFYVWTLTPPSSCAD